jgi:hypothetical protein
MKNRKTFGNRYAAGGRAVNPRAAAAPVANKMVKKTNPQPQAQRGSVPAVNKAAKAPVGNQRMQNAQTTRGNPYGFGSQGDLSKLPTMPESPQSPAGINQISGIGQSVGGLLGGLTGGQQYGGMNESYSEPPQYQQRTMQRMYPVDTYQQSLGMMNNMEGYADYGDMYGYSDYGNDGYGGYDNMGNMGGYPDDMGGYGMQPQYGQTYGQTMRQMPPQNTRQPNTELAQRRRLGQVVPGDKGYVKKMGQEFFGNFGQAVPPEALKMWQNEQRVARGKMPPVTGKKGFMTPGMQAAADVAAQNPKATTRPINKKAVTQNAKATTRPVAKGGKRKAAGGSVASTKKSAPAYRGGGLARKGMGMALAKGGMAKRNTSRGKGK